MTARARFVDWCATRFPSPADALGAYFEDAAAAALSVGAMLDTLPEVDGKRHYLPNLAGRNDKRQLGSSQKTENKVLYFPFSEATPKFDGREFMRQSGAAWINVQAGWLDEGKGPVQQPVPYGPLPRLALAWISTQAVRTKDREIAIGSSASEFLRLLGKPTTGGVRGSFTTLRKQMHALAACRLQLGFKGRTFNGQPVEQFDAWLANRETGQQALWPGLLVLSDGYFNSLVENAVPLDNRALMALSDSALALDVYTWLAHRLHRIEGRGVTLHWKAIREQFAQEYKGKDPDKDFKKEFVPAIKKVLAVYPQAKVKPVTGGVLLLGSPPPIAYKG